MCSPTFGNLNVEVTVTGQRGWVDETNRELAADMSVIGKIWFSPSAQKNMIVKFLWHHFKKSKRPFPSDKANAIEIYTHKRNDPKQPIFPLNRKESSDFDIPDFAKHSDAWTVGNLGVEIGEAIKKGDPVVDDFNELILDVFNMGTGNMLQKGNVLTWNLWFAPPGLVDTKEWRTHAERWRKSIDTDHGSPHGSGTEAKYFDGTPFKADLDFIEKDEYDKLKAFIKKHL